MCVLDRYRPIRSYIVLRARRFGQLRYKFVSLICYTQEKMEVAETKMLRWMCAVTRLDKISNEKIGGTTKVGEISKKVQ